MGALGIACGCDAVGRVTWRERAGRGGAVRICVPKGYGYIPDSGLTSSPIDAPTAPNHPEAAVRRHQCDDLIPGPRVLMRRYPMPPQLEQSP